MAVLITTSRRPVLGCGHLCLKVQLLFFLNTANADFKLECK